MAQEKPREAQRSHKRMTRRKDVGLEKMEKMSGDQVLARIYCNDQLPWRQESPQGPADLGSAIGLAPQSPGLLGCCHDPQHSGACWTYFPWPQTRHIDPGSILAEQHTMPDEATKVGMWNTDAHICAPSLFSSQRVYIYPTSTGNFPSLEIN